MKTSALRRSLLLGALAVIGLGAVQAEAASVTIRFPTEYSMDIAPGLANQEFKRLVEEASKGDIEVKFYPEGSLYKGVDLLQGVMRGDAEMATLVNAYWTAISPRLAVFELPYAFPTMEVFRKAAENEAFIKQAFAEVEQKGGVVLSIIPNEFLAPGTRSKPLRSTSDFKGLRIRSLGRANLATLRAWDATPVSLNLTELAPALQQGLVDGLNVPIDVYSQYKLHEYVREITHATYGITFYPWVVNRTWWNGLNENQRSHIKGAVLQASSNHWERVRQIKDRAIAELKAAGVKVHIQTPEELKEWRAKSDPVWDQFREQIGTDLVSKLLEIQK